MILGLSVPTQIQQIHWHIFYSQQQEQFYDIIEFIDVNKYI